MDLRKAEPTANIAPSRLLKAQTCWWLLAGKSLSCFHRMGFAGCARGCAPEAVRIQAPFQECLQVFSLSSSNALRLATPQAWVWRGTCAVQCYGGLKVACKWKPTGKQSSCFFVCLFFWGVGPLRGIENLTRRSHLESKRHMELWLILDPEGMPESTKDCGFFGIASCISNNPPEKRL